VLTDLSLTGGCSPAGPRGFVLIDDPIEHFPELVAVALNVGLDGHQGAGQRPDIPS
jgi:hypothetical protein